MKRLEGYLVVLSRAEDAFASILPDNVSKTNPRYRGIFRLPAYPSEVEGEREVIDDYLFGEYRDQIGLIPEKGLALELLHRFTKSPRHFETIYARTIHEGMPPSPAGLSLLGLDVTVGNSPFWSVVWDWLPKHDAFFDRLNENGLFRQPEDAQAYLNAYETECPPDPRPHLLVWEVYLVETGARTKSTKNGSD